MNFFKLLKWQFTIEKFSKYSQMQFKKRKNEIIVDLPYWRIYIERRDYD